MCKGRLIVACFLEPENIMRMDWLVENVEGEIPEISELVAKAKPVVDTQGLKS